MSEEEDLDRLCAGLRNFERTRRTAEHWSLDTTRALLGELEAPAGSSWVQVGGSKGKGTTVAYLEALARSAGLRTGAYVSPHLQRVNERVRIDGESVTAGLLLCELRAVLEVAGREGLDPSFFEAITVAAARIFVAQSVDVAVFEVGLGGRLDSTTAVPVDAVVLTRIELEHTELLGETRQEIAWEKACIMRAGKPAFVQHDSELSGLFADHAERVGAQFRPVPEAGRIEPGPEAVGGELNTDSGPVPFRLAGASQFEVPALALSFACLRELRPDLRWGQPLSTRPRLPGRFEVLAQRDGWPLILDGAHTAESAAQTVAELRRRFFWPTRGGALRLDPRKALAGGLEGPATGGRYILRHELGRSRRRATRRGRGMVARYGEEGS